MKGRTNDEWISPNSDSQARSDCSVARITLPGETEPLDIYSDAGFRALTQLWVMAGWQRKLSYEPTWLGMPIIQLPEDILMMQELLYKVRPGVIVETGVAHGGSAIFYASILELLGHGRVVAVDIEIRKYNRLAILSHPLSDRIKLIEGDSTAADTFQKVQESIPPGEPVLVTLDSSHARDHVLRELEMYSPLIPPGGYIVVFDTVMELLADVPDGHADWRDTVQQPRFGAFSRITLSSRLTHTTIDWAPRIATEAFYGGWTHTRLRQRQADGVS